MSANIRRYEDYLDFLPEEERKAVEKALNRKKEDEPVEIMITDTRRKNIEKPGSPETAEDCSATPINDKKRLETVTVE